MSVKIICPRATQTNATSTGTDQYEKAQYVKVINGHLHVLAQDTDRTHDVMAVYAPDQWYYASTDV